MSYKIFQQNMCPICSAIFTQKNRSKEHIFPKWLIKKCNLENENLTLLNGTAMKYKNVLIPCCKKCNSNLGGTLENKIEKILTKNEEYLLVAWLVKIYLSLRYLEQRLLLDVRQKEKGGILPSNFLEDQEQLMFSFIRTFGKRINLQGPPPWSLFKYKISKKEKGLFWYYDSISMPFISIQVKNVAFVCLLTDGGGQASVLSEPYKQDKRRRVTQKDFVELTLRHLYKQTLQNYVPKFITVEDTTDITIINMNSFVSYNKWRAKEYSNFKKGFYEFLNVFQKL